MNRAENENGEQFRRRGWRTKEGDGTEDGFGNENGERFRRRGRKTVTETECLERTA